MPICMHEIPLAFVQRTRMWAFVCCAHTDNISQQPVIMHVYYIQFNTTHCLIALDYFVVVVVLMRAVAQVSMNCNRQILINAASFFWHFFFFFWKKKTHFKIKNMLFFVVARFVCLCLLCLARWCIFFSFLDIASCCFVSVRCIFVIKCVCVCVWCIPSRLRHSTCQSGMGSTALNDKKIYGIPDYICLCATKIVAIVRKYILRSPRLAFLLCSNTQIRRSCVRSSRAALCV